MKRLRVPIAGDHTPILSGIEAFLMPHCDIVESVMDGGSLVAAAQRLNPDIVVLDVAIRLAYRN